MDDLTKLQTIGWIRDHWQDFAMSLPCVDTLLYFDIDTFISVNDLFGMQEGDMKLAGVATAIRSSIPARYPVVRFAGEEFMALVDSRQYPEETLRELLEVLDEPEYKIKVDYSNIGHFSVSCCMLKIGGIDSFMELGGLTDLAIDAIRKMKTPAGFRKYMYQGVLAIENVA